jgi:hypothetical protein
MVERLTAQHARCREDDPLELPPLAVPAPARPMTATGGCIQQRRRTWFEQIEVLVQRGTTITAIGWHLQLDRKRAHCGVA